MLNEMHACSAGPVGRRIYGEPSFTVPLNTTKPAESSFFTVKLGSELGCDEHDVPQCLRNLIVVSSDIRAPVRGQKV